jgi:hypothetical protein
VSVCGTSANPMSIVPLAGLARSRGTVICPHRAVGRPGSSGHSASARTVSMVAVSVGWTPAVAIGTAAPPVTTAITAVTAARAAAIRVFCMGFLCVRCGLSP